jgi:hypothetical protein
MRWPQGVRSAGFYLASLCLAAVAETLATVDAIFARCFAAPLPVLALLPTFLDDRTRASRTTLTEYHRRHACPEQRTQLPYL